MPARLSAIWLLLAASGQTLAGAGPVDAGRAEVRSAAEARKLSGAAFRHLIEQSMALPLESYQIQGALIRGGSPRALLYALIDAAGSLTRRGVVSASRGEAELAIRGVRRTLRGADFDLPREHWQGWFRALAMARFNRARLILPPAGQDLEQFLRMTAEFADPYAIDVTLDLPPVAPAALHGILRISPVVRALYATHGNLETATGTAQAAGRYVVVETAPGATVQPGIPSRVLAPWRAGAGRPCAPLCEFVWVFEAGSTAPPGLKGSGAAGFEIDHSDLEAWSGAGYKISQSAPAPARKAPVRKKAATARKR
ncbi:MAG: hypothetical protein C0504_19355 [Candidatus Solibacter sp.]|nr:hypothetical protein [Candidatus Solibacter sp.]